MYRCVVLLRYFSLLLFESSISSPLFSFRFFFSEPKEHKRKEDYYIQLSVSNKDGLYVHSGTQCRSADRSIHSTLKSGISN